MLNGLLQQARAELADISAKVSRSRGQVEELAQRNAMIIGEVRRIESVLDQTPRLNIRETYSNALDVQQRLLTLRGQMERLQAEENSARRMVEVLEAAIDTLSRTDAEAGPGDTFDAREMIIRVIDAQEETNERLARLMHDGPAHSLTNFILQAEIVAKLFDRDPQKAREELSNLKNAANEAFQKVRSFIFDLRPMMLTDLGLVPTVKRYLEAFGDKTGIETAFELIGRERRLSEHYREVLLFRGIQALIQNARDHSGASYIKVVVEMGEDSVRARVEDNGRGFGTGKLSLDASNSEALGLGALQERVNLVGGMVRVDSIAGQGARIEIDIPASWN
jgi:two-component system sensor histidine kinase DegS